MLSRRLTKRERNFAFPVVLTFACVSRLKGRPSLRRLLANGTRGNLPRFLSVVFRLYDALLGDVKRPTLLRTTKAQIAFSRRRSLTATRLCARLLPPLALASPKTRPIGPRAFPSALSSLVCLSLVYLSQRRLLSPTLRSYERRASNATLAGALSTR